MTSSRVWLVRPGPAVRTLGDKASFVVWSAALLRMGFALSTELNNLVDAAIGPSLPLGNVRYYYDGPSPTIIHTVATAYPSERQHLVCDGARCDGKRRADRRPRDQPEIHGDEKRASWHGADDGGLGGSVTLFLNPETNEHLRPKLERELRPGSRVVSHWWPFKSWVPARVDHVQSPDGAFVHSLYLYLRERLPPAQ
jgi:hypothetical protein